MEVAKIDQSINAFLFLLIYLRLLSQFYTNMILQYYLFLPISFHADSNEYSSINSIRIFSSEPLFTSSGTPSITIVFLLKNFISNPNLIKYGLISFNNSNAPGSKFKSFWKKQLLRERYICFKSF